jgi:hypothetical protein
MKLRTVLIALMLLSAVPAFSQSQPWKKQIALDANLSIPGGEFADLVGLEMGFGGTAAFYYQLLTRVTFLSVSLGYNDLSFEGSSNAKYTVIPLLIGARYNFALTGFQPYVGFEFGAYFQSVSTSDGQISLTESETNVGFQPKVGFRFPLSPGLDFDASLKYHLILRENESFSMISPGIGIAYTID